jgi:hypothetical protein
VGVTIPSVQFTCAQNSSDKTSQFAFAACQQYVLSLAALGTRAWTHNLEGSMKLSGKYDMRGTQHILASGQSLLRTEAVY